MSRYLYFVGLIGQLKSIDQLNYAARFSYCIFQNNWVSTTTKYLLIFTEVDKLEELSE